MNMEREDGSLVINYHAPPNTITTLNFRGSPVEDRGRFSVLMIDTIMARVRGAGTAILVP